ncbi:MAG: KOW motif-containing protein [Fimbriiglobus sp.]
MSKPRQLTLPSTSIFKPDGFVEFGFEWSDALLFWKVMLAITVRDKAMSFHFHPWKSSGELWYVIERERIGLTPPAPEMARMLALAAGALLTGSLGGLIRRRLNWPIRAGGQLWTDGEFGPAVFTGVVWAEGGIFGVDWHRLDLRQYLTKPPKFGEPIRPGDKVRILSGAYEGNEGTILSSAEALARWPDSPTVPAVDWGGLNWVLTRSSYGDSLVLMEPNELAPIDDPEVRDEISHE